MTIMTVLLDLLSNVSSVARGVLPLLALFLILDLAYLKLPFKVVMRMIIGTLIASIGLILFISGVNLCFYPIGEEIGQVIASFKFKWIIPLVGIVLGFVAALSEPSIRILADQVNNFTSGVIKRNIVIYTISIGVALAVFIGMCKIVYAIPFRYIILPGYVFALVMMFFSDEQFISIAFDSGGVATGPLPAVFLTGVSMGVVSVVCETQTTADSFGLVALIVMAPLIAMLCMGTIYRIGKNRRNKKK